MKKTLDTEPGQAVEVRARRAAKLIEAAVERRSGQRSARSRETCSRRSSPGSPRRSRPTTTEVQYSDFRFDDTLVAAGAGRGYFHMFRALRAATEYGLLSRLGRHYDHADWDYFAFDLSAMNAQGAVLADAVYTPRLWDERN